MAVGQVSFHNDKKVRFYYLTILNITHPYNRSKEVLSHHQVKSVVNPKNSCLLACIRYMLPSVKTPSLIALIKLKSNASIVSNEKMLSNELLLLRRYSTSRYLVVILEFCNISCIEKARCGIGEKERRRKGCSIIWFLFNVEVDESSPRKTVRELEEVFM